MAANTNSLIRLRLFFDYPPPAVADCRMCWLLVDLKTCRVVADVESVIRDKFNFSSRSIVSLFIDDCYLPHTEHVLLLRDNDSVRVKVDSLSQVNGHSGSSDRPAKSCKKRKRPADHDGPAGTGPGLDLEEKRAKTNDCEIQEEPQEVSKKKKKKKKKKEPTIQEKTPPAAPKQSPAPRESAVSVQPPGKRTGNPPAATKKKKAMASSSSSSQSSSSSGVEDQAPKRPPAPKPAAKTPSSSKTHRQTPKAKPRPGPPPASGSSQTESSSDDDDIGPPKLPHRPLGSSPPKTKPHPPPPSEPRPRNRADPDPKPHPPDQDSDPRSEPPDPKDPAVPDSDSDDEIKLVIRKPAMPPPRGWGPGGRQRSAWRGGGGRGWRGGRGGGGGGATGGQAHSAEPGCNGIRTSCHQDDLLTNVSKILENGSAAPPPQQDYGSLPLLAAPPQVGQKIAFKLLELAENYTPEISDYKEGRIVNFDPSTRQIELELLHTARAPVEPGRFDLVYQNPDGSERVEYAVSRGDRVTERWESLLEPRLMM